jgi:FkbM family methyltransferase
MRVAFAGKPSIAMVNLGAVLNRTQRRLGRSPRATRAAVLLRNQCNRVIRYHLTPSDDPAENGELWLLDRIAPGVEVFFDVGANVGEWTAALLERAPAARGVLVEPGPEAGERLRTRFGDRVEIVAAAAGDQEGVATFWEETGAGERSSVVPGFSDDAVERSVPMTTIDALATTYGLNRIDLLKIDVEGFDARVIRGASGLLKQRRVGAMQFEYNRPWASAGDTLLGTIRELDELGYRTSLLTPQGLRHIESQWGEYFDYTNLVALPEGSDLIPS